jgi:type II secretory pathway component GspD/PulD (secretin)
VKVRAFIGLAAVLVLFPTSGQGAAAASRTPRPNKPAAAARAAPRRAAESLRPGAAVVIGGEERRYTGEPISLDLKDADIRDVLLTFAKLTRMNMVIDPEVKGTVTVRLEDVPWDQALEVILKVNGLGYVIDGNVTRVAQPGKLHGTP